MDTTHNPETNRALKVERLEARVTKQLKELLQRAADMSGLSLTDFIVTSAQKAAEEAIRQNNVITLTKQDSLLFAEAILNPSQPNERLQAALAKHNDEVISMD